LNIHNNRKTPCNISKQTLECKCCNIKFKCSYDQTRHEKTKKHKFNIENHDHIINNQDECINTNKYNDELIDHNNKINMLENIIKNLNNTVNELNNKNENLNIENINLTEKLNKLLLENNLLKSNINKNLEHYEQIYIIHERTFVELNANIYKIGKTKNIKNRLNGYNKGSQLLYTIPCNDCSRMETIILNYLKSNNNYIQAKEYGNEYFICDLNILINDIHTLVKNN
jgi:hypothetical protein